MGGAVSIDASGGRCAADYVLALPWPRVFSYNGLLAPGRCQTYGDVLNVAQTRLVICFVFYGGGVPLHYLTQ